MKNRILRSWWGRLLLVVIVIAAIVGGWLWSLATRGHFLAGGGSTTAMFVHYEMPYPWPRGNYFTVFPRWHYLRERHLPWLSRFFGRSSDWAVVNMYSENHTEIVKVKGIQWTEVERLRDGRCAVVDPRIPRSWLSASPLRVSLAEGRRLRLERPELFAVDPECEALVGTSWTLTARQDPDGFLERLLPGRRIDFEKVDLRCSGREDAAAERRTWQLSADSSANARHADSSADDPRLTLAVYELRGEAYEGIAVGLIHDGDTMTITLGSTIHSNGQSVESRGYRVLGRDAWARYTRVETGK